MSIGRYSHYLLKKITITKTGQHQSINPKPCNYQANTLTLGYVDSPVEKYCNIAMPYIKYIFYDILSKLKFIRVHTRFCTRNDLPFIL